jgi:hypothetical protein
MLSLPLYVKLASGLSQRYSLTCEILSFNKVESLCRLGYSGLHQYVVMFKFTNVSKDIFAYYLPSILKMEASGSSEMLVAIYILCIYTASQT